MTRLLHLRGLIATFILVLFGALAGCSTLTPQQQSVAEQVQSGKDSVTAAYRKLGDLVGDRTIGMERGRALYSKIEAVDKQVTLAGHLLQNGMPGKAEPIIDVALKAMTELRVELERQAQGA